MRVAFFISCLTAVAVSQTIDIAGVKEYPTPATPTFATGVPTQVIAYKPASAAASVYAEVIAALHHLRIGTLATTHIKQREAAPDPEANPSIGHGLKPIPVGPVPGPKPVSITTSAHRTITHMKTTSSHIQLPSHVSVHVAARDVSSNPSIGHGLRPIPVGPVPGPKPVSVTTSAHHKTTHTKPTSSHVEMPSHVSVHLAARDDSTASTPCQPEATGVGPVPKPDTPAAFASDPYFGKVAVAAPVPENYENVFTNLTASNIAYGYLGYQYIEGYYPKTCASLCDDMDGCTAFNIYFERDPQITPGTACPNPNSTTTIKCAFWGGDINIANAINSGQYRQKFEVLIAGSNGYVRHDGCNNAAYPGYSQPVYLGNGTILAQPDCNGVDSYLGWDFISTGPFDTNLCAAACTAMSVGNLANNNTKTCQFYATYLLNKNDVALGQYCALYSEYWDSSFATNVGQWDGTDHYTISNAYSSYNLTNPGYAKPKCSWQHVPTANAVCSAVDASTTTSASSVKTSSSSSTVLGPIITSTKASSALATTTLSSSINSTPTVSSSKVSTTTTAKATSVTSTTPMSYSPSPSMTTSTIKATSASTSTTSKSTSTTPPLPSAYVTTSSASKSSTTSTTAKATLSSYEPPSYYRVFRVLF